MATPVKQHQKRSSSILTISQKIVLNLLRITSKVNSKWGAELGLLTFATPFKRHKKVPSLPLNTKVTSSILAGKKIIKYQYGKSTQKILLIHGWEGAATDFSDYFEILVKQGLEVCAIDLPGHGESPKSSLNAVVTAKIIKEIEIKDGPFTAIVGHSFGAFSTGYALSQFEELSEIPFVSIGSPNKLKNVLENFTSFVGLNKTQHNYMSCKLEKKLNIKIHELEQGNFIQAHDGPVLVIHDKLDKQVAFSNAEEIKTKMVNGKFVMTEGLGHNRILKDQQTIMLIIDFISTWKNTRETYLDAYKFGLINI